MNLLLDESRVVRLKVTAAALSQPHHDRVPGDDGWRGWYMEPLGC